MHILNKGDDDVVRRKISNSTRSPVKYSTNKYYVTNKNRDGSFFVVENIDSTNWIEWYVKKEPILGNRLYPSGIYSWELIEDNGNGTVILYDETRSAYSKLSSEGWFLEFPENSDFWLYNKGSWSAYRPAEIANGMRTFEICQRGVNNCADGGDKPGCCGPYGDERCCNFNTNTCNSC